MRLIDNASKWYRMFSVQALAAIATLQGVALAMPASMLESRVPFLGGSTWADLNLVLSLLAALLGVVGRLTKQDGIDKGSTAA